MITLLMYKYFNPEVSTEYVTFGDGMNLKNVSVEVDEKSGIWQMAVYDQSETEVLTLPMIDDNGNKLVFNYY